MEFRKYQHIERFGTDEVADINFGECYIFPKIDGTNASVWIDDDGVIHAGSRNRELSLDNDNAGFMAAVVDDKNIAAFLMSYPHLRLYGEWLVPHSLKTYRDEAWRKFYVFDVYDGGRPLHYEHYSQLLEEYGIEYLPPIAIGKNLQYDDLIKLLPKNVFLVQDGEGYGEGIVIKNYEFENRHGRTIWAKIVTSEFKEKAHKEMGAPIVKGADVVEEKIVDKFCTKEMIGKAHAKIVNDEGAWTSKMIPRLLGTVFYDLVREETWNFVKEFKNPRVDFGLLNRMTIMKVKSEAPELFGYPAKGEK